MAPKPAAERHPEGLDAYWTHVWEHALKVMKEQGTWAWELRPLLDEYVFALIAADHARRHDDETKWDRCSKRAHLLANTLILTPDARRRHGGSDTEEAADPFAKFTGDELAEKRKTRGGPSVA